MGGILVFVLLCSVGTVAGQTDNSAGVQGTGDISEDIAPYNGTIGADSPLHGLKLAMEDLDETFTFDDARRVEKRLDHAQLRIAEFRQELDLNRTRAAERALEQYRAETEPDRTIIGTLWVQCYRTSACAGNDYPASGGPGRSNEPAPG